jgi:hypothetical protein
MRFVLINTAMHLAYQAMTIADVMMGNGSNVAKHALEVS